MKHISDFFQILNKKTKTDKNTKEENAYITTSSQLISLSAIVNDGNGGEGVDDILSLIEEYSCKFRHSNYDYRSKSKFYVKND